MRHFGSSCPEVLFFKKGFYTMPYVNIPNDLSKIKSKVAFNLTKRQLICFGIAAVVGIPAYIFTRSYIGNSGAMLLMIGLMLPFFFFAMYERDGLPAEKVMRNILRNFFTRPGKRPYKTENIYITLTKGETEIGTNKKTATAAKKYKARKK